MTPSEIIKNTVAISNELAEQSWSVVDLTLQEFGYETSPTWDGDIESYVMTMISNTPEGQLFELAKHLGVVSTLESESQPKFWNEKQCRVFLSHLTTSKHEVGALQSELRKLGIIAFVAHEDIAPTLEWQSEIEAALSTMDALVAVLVPGFIESKWCDQEVGVAIGRRVQIVSVRNELDPHGFIGKFQGIQGAGRSAKEIAIELYEIFRNMPNMGEKILNTLVDDFTNASNFEKAKNLIILIEGSPYLTTKHIQILEDAQRDNPQVSGSWGVPARIAAIARTTKPAS